jgi:glycosyltransferase involved in cell wall biosynthesis
MKVLVVTNLFPNCKEPTRGMYNAQLLCELAALCEIKVVAPVPFAFPLKFRKDWYSFSQVLAKETAGEIEVYHPRYFVTPKLGRSLYGYFFFLSLDRFVRNLRSTFAYDLLFVPWIYPDGTGISFIARRLGIPIVLQALGSDINVHTNYLLRRTIIARTLQRSDKVIAVSDALRSRILALNVPENKVVSLKNGVNKELFNSMDKTACRNKLSLSPDDRIILFIGNLVPIKGVDHLIEAVALLGKDREKVKLVIVGGGPLQESLTNKAESLGVRGSVLFAGRRSHDEIPVWMNACDIFCLPSLNEGCPNVVLEALACGKPVIATRVGGIPELIRSEDCGFLVQPADTAALAKAMIKALTKKWDPVLHKKGAQVMSWQENARLIYDEFRSVLAAYGTHQ